MGAQSIESKFKSLGKGDQVGAKAAFHGDPGLFADGFGRPTRIAQAVKRCYTQSWPPMQSRHKSIRIQEPIRFAEMRGIQKFRRGRMKMLCPHRAQSDEGVEWVRFPSPSPVFA